MWNFDLWLHSCIKIGASSLNYSEISFQSNSNIDPSYSLTFWCRKKSSLEKSYEIKMSGLVAILKLSYQWCYYVESALHKRKSLLTIRILESFSLMKIRAARQQDQMEEPSGLDIQIEYWPGKLKLLNNFLYRPNWNWDNKDRLIAASTTLAIWCHYFISNIRDHGLIHNVLYSIYVFPWGNSS